ncbi:MAG TPA: hypothetical protein VNQ53_16410 [Nocardioides sp.]|nr:hypothetical protein [Nocardioides sp.]
MNLHEHLRDLVARQGPTVIESAESFRAALDDFLSEDEATTGELNLLVDAVRLGAVHRMISMIDQGAEPVAAVREAGDVFARDRGTDDLVRCRWAVAVVGFALGRVEEGVALTSSAPSVPAPPPAPPQQPPAQPPAPQTEEPRRPFPETQPVASAPPAEPPAPPPPPSPSQPARRRTGTIVLAALLVAAVAIGVILAGMWLGNRDDDAPEETADSSNEPGSGSAGDEPNGGDSGGSAEGAIPTDSLVVPLTDESDETRIYVVDAETGAAEPITDGPADRLPAISPDRSQVIYLETSEASARTPMLLDLASGETRPLLNAPAPACEYAARPGFSPAGNRLVVICLDEFDNYASTYVVDLRGEVKDELAISGEPLGTPTWTSVNNLVYALAGYPEDQPSTLWGIEVGGNSPRQLTDGSAGWDSHPDWSDEAGLLLYSQHETEDFFGNVLTMDANGEPGPSTSGALWAHPTWSPDGTRIAFTVLDDGEERLAVAPLDDLTDVTYVPDLPGEPGAPAWGSR